MSPVDEKSPIEWQLHMRGDLAMGNLEGAMWTLADRLQQEHEVWTDTKHTEELLLAATKVLQEQIKALEEKVKELELKDKPPILWTLDSLGGQNWPDGRPSP